MEQAIEILKYSVEKMWPKIGLIFLYIIFFLFLFEDYTGKPSNQKKWRKENRGYDSGTKPDQSYYAFDKKFYDFVH